MSAELLIQRKGIASTIRRPTTTKASGIPIQTYATHISGVLVYIQEYSASENVRYGRESSRVFGKAFIKSGYDIQAKDQILQDGRYYDIQDRPQTRGEGRTLQMVCEVQETDGTP